MVRFLKEAKRNLRKIKEYKEKKNKYQQEDFEWKVGLLFVKENTTEHESYTISDELFDDVHVELHDQNHRVRTRQHYEDLFK